MAFGLCTAKADSATVAESYIGFEAEEAGVPASVPGDSDWPVNDDESRLLWFSAATEADEITATVKVYGDEALADAGANYLEIETGDNPLIRTAAAVVDGEEDAQTGVKPKIFQSVDIAQGVVFDQLVKFSAYESEAEVPTNDVTMKIGLWLKQTEEDDDTHATDGLYVSTAMLNTDFEPTLTNVWVDLPANVVTGGWNHLTITAVKAYDISGVIVPGFVIAIDGTEVNYTGDQLFAAGAGSEFVTTFAAPLITAKKIFPSRIIYNDDGKNPATMVGMGIRGSGAIDEISVAKKSFLVTASVVQNANVTGAGEYKTDEPDVSITATPKTGFTYAGVDLPAGGEIENDVISYAVTVAGDDVLVTVPDAVAADVTITLPASLPEGVTSLLVEQSANGTDWNPVSNGKIAIGNQWRVTATAATGKTVTNPVATGTAEAGVSINITSEQIEAQIRVATYTITFVIDGQANIVSNDVAYGTAFANVKPADPEKAGYTFTGWTPVVETIDGTYLTFTAQFTQDIPATGIAESYIGFEAEEPGVPASVPGEFDWTVNDGESRLLWYSAGAAEDITATVKAYDEEDEAGANYLEVETGADPLFRTAAAVNVTAQGAKNTQTIDIAQGAVFEQLVKCSA